MRIASPVSASQITTLRSKLPEMMRLPFGKYATDEIRSVSPVRVLRTCPDVESQIFSVRSTLPDTSVRPFGANATEVTGPECPLNVRSLAPEPPEPPDKAITATINRTVAKAPAIDNRTILPCRLSGHSCSRQSAGTADANEKVLLAVAESDEAGVWTAVRLPVALRPGASPDVAA